MKLKILAKLVEKILGVADNGDGPRADMFLPDRLLAMAFVLLAVGLGFGIYAVFDFVVWKVVVAVIGVVLGVFAILCWKNQTIHVISEEQFTYTTMFGKTRTYNFSDIKGLLRNQDSMTMLVGNDKVHIESMAILSDRLIDSINKALEQRRNNK